MSPFQSIVDKLGGIEQFLLGEKLYLAAGVFRQLYEDMVREGLADPPRLAPVENLDGVWETIENLRSEMWEQLVRTRELDEMRKVELYNRWLRWLAAAYYQLRLSAEAAPVLENYLTFRALTMLRGRPAHTEEVLWQWWLELKKLAKILLDIHSETNFLFENYRQEMPRPEEEEDYWSEPEFEEELYSMAELALDWIIGSDAPVDYERFGTLSVYAFRDLREWARYGGEFYNRLAYEITKQAKRLVRRELIDELLGRDYMTVNFTVSSSQSLTEKWVVEEVSSMVVPRRNAEGVGLKAGAAKVIFFIADEQRTFPLPAYVYVLEPTSEIGQRIISKIIEKDPTWYTFGARAVYFAFGEAEFGVAAAKLETVTDEVFWEVAKEKLVDADNEWVRVEFLRQLQRSGLLEDMDMISAVIQWVERLGNDPKTQIRAWEAVNSFLRGYYEQQRRGPIHGDVVLDEIRRWLEVASEMLYKYGHLESLPENKEERQRFLNDIRRFISRTEEMLSSLHGSGGMLTKLTRSGTYSDLFRLIGLREGVLLPEAARRYWLHEGDKKLLLKWLLLREVIGWGEKNA